MQVKQETNEPLKALNTIADFMEGVRTVAIAGHEKPDGDCIGACLACYLYLRQNCPDVQVDVYLEEARDVFDFLEGMDQVKRTLDDPTKVYDLMILMDISSDERVGVAGPLLARAKTRICFDHHATNDGEYDWKFNYPGASSTCEVFCNFLDAQKVGPRIAEALFAGIANDTGVFRYASTSPKTHQLAANLMQRGIDAPKIIEETYYDRSFEQQKMLGRVLQEAQLLYDGRVIASMVSKEEMDALGLSSVDMEGIVAQLRNTRGTEITVFLYEIEDGVHKLSLRSRRLDVSKIAAALGGGGHRRAAGATVTGPAYEVLAKLSPLLEQALAEQPAEEPQGQPVERPAD